MAFVMTLDAVNYENARKCVAEFLVEENVDLSKVWYGNKDTLVKFSVLFNFLE